MANNIPGRLDLDLVYEIILKNDTIVFIAEASEDVDYVIDQVRRITSSIPELKINIQSKPGYYHPLLTSICKEYLILDLRDYQSHFIEHPFSLAENTFPYPNVSGSFYFKVSSRGISVWDGTSGFGKNDIVYRVVDELPRFPGCESETAIQISKAACAQNRLNEFVREEMRYTKAARQMGLTGMVIVQFIVEKDGSLSEVKLALRRHPLLDQEALRIAWEIQALPEKWMPGKRNGYPVRTQYELPIRFGIF